MRACHWSATVAVSIVMKLVASRRRPLESDLPSHVSVGETGSWTIFRVRNVMPALHGSLHLVQVVHVETAQSRPVGVRVGAGDGFAVGTRVGSRVVGGRVGYGVGLREGDGVVGTGVGTRVGEGVGAGVGTAVGSRVGSNVGDLVGFRVGEGVGGRVGSLVGAGVG